MSSSWRPTSWNAARRSAAPCSVRSSKDGRPHSTSKERTTAILGNGQVTGLEFKDGRTLDCDMVVIVRRHWPNADTRARRRTDRRTRHRRRQRSQLRQRFDIYAVGECVEHRGRVYGRRADLGAGAGPRRPPDRAQPDAAYTRLQAGDEAQGHGRRSGRHGRHVPAEPPTRSCSHRDPKRGVYKKLFLREGRWSARSCWAIPACRLRRCSRRSTATSRRPPTTGLNCCSPTQRRDQDGERGDLPDNAQIRNCNGVTKGKPAVIKRGRMRQPSPRCATPPGRARAAGRASRRSRLFSNSRRAIWSSMTRRATTTCRACRWQAGADRGNQHAACAAYPRCSLRWRVERGPGEQGRAGLAAQDALGGRLRGRARRPVHQRPGPRQHPA